jgi:hypothetical protein
MPFDSSQHGAADPALASGSPARRPKRLVGGVNRWVAATALVVAAALIAGLAWNLVKTQDEARDSLDDAIQRRAGLTADVISSVLVSSRPQRRRARYSAVIPRRCGARSRSPASCAARSA